jgi:hypothetical protein
MVGCGFFDRLMRNVQVYATPMANGDIAALVVNWREITHD